MGAVLFFVAGAGSSVYLSDVAENDWSRTVCAVVVRGARHDVFWTPAAALRERCVSAGLASVLHDASPQSFVAFSLITLAIVSDRRHQEL